MPKLILDISHPGPEPRQFQGVLAWFCFLVSGFFVCLFLQEMTVNTEWALSSSLERGYYLFR